MVKRNSHNRASKLPGRLRFVAALVTVLAASGSVLAAEFAILKTEGCRCCDKWAEHLHQNGHATTTEHSEDMASVKREAGVPEALWSCHTAMVEGYVIEGHVPAADIERLLAERPEAVGLSVPGMPVGSPGMEYQDRVDPYEVILFFADGTSEVFASH